MEFKLTETNKEALGRWFPVATPINDTEIVILGGMSLVDDELSCLGDVFIFDSQTGSFNQSIQNFSGLLQF